MPSEEHEIAQTQRPKVASPSRPSPSDDLGLRIAWLGVLPREAGGASEVATEVLDGLTSLGHRVDCFLTTFPTEIPKKLENRPNLTMIWTAGPLRWQWNRWYSRSPLTAFVSGLMFRSAALVRFRRILSHRHAEDPYDLIYQFSTMETLGVPRALAKSVPLVLHPSTHSAGELRWLLAERHLARRGEPWHRTIIVGATLFTRSLVQRLTVGRARLMICLSRVFRDHIVDDYRFPVERTVVIPNPVRLDRFDPAEAAAGTPQTPRIALVVGRIAVRKGIDQVVALSHILHQRGVDVRLRIIGAESQWSDYRPLLADLDPASAEYAGRVPADVIPEELAGADMLIQASKYEPFGLTVAESLAAGVPVIATNEVGASEGTSDLSLITVGINDPAALADAVEDMCDRLDKDESGVRRAARADAERLFSPELVIRQRIAAALQALAGRRQT